MKHALLLFLVLTCATALSQKSYQRTLEVEDPCTGNGIHGYFPSEGFKIYPNPTSGNISLMLPENGTATLCDAKGVIVQQSEVSSGDQWDLSGLSGGVYFLSLLTESKLFRTKIILEK